MEQNLHHICVIKTNLPTKKIALDILNKLIDEQVCKCGNILPITSLYVWEEKKQMSEEWQLVAKTSACNEEKLYSSIVKEHPYKIPYVVKMKVLVNNSYADWLLQR